MRKFAQKRSVASLKQAGFIQNLIIPGIILIGVVIAGIAMLSSGSSTSTDKEKASMLANAVMAQSLSVTSAIQRAEADGAIPATTAATSVTLTNALVTNKYISNLPTLPTDLANNAWAYDKNYAEIKNSTGDIGAVNADDVLRIELADNGTAGLAEMACQRINNKLFGTPSTDAPPAVASMLTGAAGALTVGTGSGAEGCVKDGTKYAYFKVVNVK